MDPFGSAPGTDDVIDQKVPDQKDDPFRPIGNYNDETGAYIDGPQKAEVIGKVVALEKKDSSAGIPMVVFSTVVTEGEFAGREFDIYCSFSPKARFKIIETYKAIGLPIDAPYPKAAAIGVYVVLCLKDEEYNGRWSAKCNALKPHPKGVGYRGTAALS